MDKPETDGAPTDPEGDPGGPDRYRAVQTMVLPGGRTDSEVSTSPPSGPSSRRTVESTVPARDHPLPVPNGWYAIVETASLAPGDIVSIAAVDRDLIVFRDHDGAAHVFDAHCPHLGAHLGGGRVDGEVIACPYHGWQFGTDGVCVEIPYCDARIPSRARVRSYPIDEKDGFVYFWYHAADEAPTYEIPDVSEVADPTWSDAHRFGMDMVAALQEMAENNVDYAHLHFVHRRQAVPADSSEFFIDGPRSWVVEEMPGGTTFTRYSHGPGFALLRVPDVMTLVATTTPIDRGSCRLQWHFYFPEAMADAADDIIEGVTGTFGILADVPIWRDKVYRERPVLVKGDGPLAEFRRWYSQFYDGA